MDETKRITMTEHDRTALAFARRVLMSSDHAQDVQTMQAILCLDSLADQFDESGPSCDDPGAHRPGCKCNGGEPLL